MRGLITGNADFESIRKYGNYYADKTELLYQLVRRPDQFFLSRPRRFGKTLLVSALERILQGRRELFKGLWIDGSDYDWTPCPVIRLDMSKAAAPDLARFLSRLKCLLEDAAEMNKVETKTSAPAFMLDELITDLYLDSGNKQVAILIDEYDAPVVRHLGDPAKAREIGKKLNRFYGL
ncbi:MAG: AAA family ATPase, partial [Desulfovibrio sp.]|nr:AAA family ATPase [Desulfovibrio sp.]